MDTKNQKQNNMSQDETEEDQKQNQSNEQNTIITQDTTLELLKYSKDEIIKKYIFLQQENQILRKQVPQYNKLPQPQQEEKSKKSKKEDKQSQKKEKLFDIYQSQHYALKMSYVGVNYQGLAYQIETDNTVEEQLFKALEKTTLIQSRDHCNFTRSGRTDKGVSALGQVIGITLRTSVKVGEDINEKQNKLDYVKMLNSNLPDDIRILGCQKVDSTFNARFDCIKRIYKYYFFENSMSIDSMKEATKLFIGEHDFRNYCKIDVLQTINYVRIIYQLDIEEVKIDIGSKDPRAKLYVATIVGSAFLWHQIRNIMSILFLVGKRLEQPSIVSELLDIQKNPKKPNYEMAPDYPLILYDCLYDKVQFEYKEDQIHSYDHLLNIIQKRQIETQLYLLPLNYLSQFAFESNLQEKTIKNKKYQHLSKRQCAPSSEDTLKNLKGRKLDKFQEKQEKQLNYQKQRENEKNQGINEENGNNQDQCE